MSRVVLGMVSILGLVIFAFSMTSDRKIMGPISPGMDAHPTKSSSWSVPSQTPTGTKVNTSQILFRIQGTNFMDGVIFTIQNHSNEVVDTLWLDIELTDKTGSSELKTVNFKYVDPHKAKSVTVRVPTWFTPAKAVLRKVKICELGGSYYKNCDKHILFNGSIS